MPKVTVDIPPARASQIAQFFTDEGFDVTWSAPVEKRAGGLEGDLIQVVYFLGINAAAGVVGGTAFAAAQGAARRLRERFPSLKPKVEEDDE